MSVKARARYVAQCVPILTFLGFVTVAALDTDAIAASKAWLVPSTPQAETGIIRQLPGSVEAPPRDAQHLLIAFGDPSFETPTPISVFANAFSLRGSIAATSDRVFQVMAKAGERPSQGNIQLAALDFTAPPGPSARGLDDQPFELLSSVAPDGIVWSKWRKVGDDIRREEPTLMRCLADQTTCSPAAARFVAIIKEARGRAGRVRLNFVNQRVNNAIRYTSDILQWGTPDEWSAPLAAGKGSFETGLGDCEDYAIAKYVALLAAGVSAKQLRVLLVHDNIARVDHAVLAANDDGHWFILDNRWTAAVEDNDVHRFTPLFALDDQGVKLLVASDASQNAKIAKRSMSDTKSEDNVTAIGLRPSIL